MGAVSVAAGGVTPEQALQELARRERDRRKAKTDPAFLVSRMSAPDERTSSTFTFQHLESDEAAQQSGWGWQRDWFLWHHTTSRSITLKARQLGITWLSCAALVADALLYPGSLLLVYRQKEEEAHENVFRCWALLESLPKHLWMGATVEKPSRVSQPIPTEELRLRFPDGNSSRILAMTSASASGHGKTARRVLLDEHSRIEKASEIMKAVQPAAGKTGRIGIISTANGRSNPETGDGNHFHYLWVSAEEAGFAKRFLPWNSHPDRDQAWYDHNPEVRGLRAHERAEQYPGNEWEAFTLTNRVFFDPEDLAHYREQVRKPLYRFDFQVTTTDKKARLRKHDTGHTRVFTEPKNDRTYAIGADVLGFCGGR